MHESDVRDAAPDLLDAVVQAVIDSDFHPDGPMLSERFWTILRDAGAADEVGKRATAAVYTDVLGWHEVAE